MFDSWTRRGGPKVRFLTHHPAFRYDIQRYMVKVHGHWASFLLYSGGLVKIKLKLTTLPRSSFMS